MKQVVTYQAGNGATKNICTDCAEKLESEGTWPKTSTGAEYCQVSRGQHAGRCDICTDSED